MSCRREELTLQLNAPLRRYSLVALRLNSTLIGAHVWKLDLLNAVDVQRKGVFDTDYRKENKPH